MNAIVQGGWPGEGNIYADPKFVDPGSDDYHLQLGSPCIDAGTNNAPELPYTDFEGDDRIIDGDCDGIATVYMGADEYIGVCVGFINGHVTDLEGTPIKSAFIIAINSETKEKAWAITNVDGYYEILDLEAGTYWVLFVNSMLKMRSRNSMV